MYIYWRVQQDLTCLGEELQFHDPALIRSLRRWMRKNFIGLAMVQGHWQTETIRISRN
jgi:hypothetical protein